VGLRAGRRARDTITTGRVFAAIPRSANQTSPGCGLIEQVENLLFGGARAHQIENVVVDPGWRRRGVGALLLRELLSRARQQGAASLLLEVRESNIAARELYKKMHFSEESRRPRYYRDPEEDALLLRLALE